MEFAEGSPRRAEFAGLSGELQPYAANPVMESTVSSVVNPSNPAAPLASTFILAARPNAETDFLPPDTAEKYPRLKEVANMPRVNVEPNRIMIELRDAQSGALHGHLWLEGPVVPMLTRKIEANFAAMLFGREPGPGIYQRWAGEVQEPGFYRMVDAVRHKLPDCEPPDFKFEIVSQTDDSPGRCFLNLKWENNTVSTERVSLALARHLRNLILAGVSAKAEAMRRGELTVDLAKIKPEAQPHGPPNLALVKDYVGRVVDPNVKPTDNIDIMQIQRAFTNAIMADRPDWRSTNVTLTMHEGRVIKSIDFVVGFENRVFHYSHEVHDLERLGIEPAERCIACDKPFERGELVMPDASGGRIHDDCAGPEREGYTGKGGEPLADGEPIPKGTPFEPDPEEFQCVILGEGPRHGEIDFGESDEGVRLEVQWRDDCVTVEHVSKRGAKLFGWKETPEVDVTDPAYQAQKIIALLEVELGVKGPVNVFRKALEYAKQARDAAVVPLVEAPPEMTTLLDDVLKDLRFAASAFKAPNGIIQLIAITQTKINSSNHPALRNAQVKSVKLLTATTDFPNGAIRFEVEYAGQFVEVVKEIDE